MATYNGSVYVRDQLLSILSELGGADEVIVVDDASSDNTVEVVLAVSDTRVSLMRNETNQGHVESFAKALAAARGEYILLSDQDDLWVEGRVSSILAALGRRTVAAGRFEYFGEISGRPPRDLPELRVFASQRNLFSILTGRRPYFGSAMGFRREILPVLLPIPRYAEAHDIWLAIVGNVLGGVDHVDELVLRRRIHRDNLTPRHRRGIGRIVQSRFGMLRLMHEAKRRNTPARLGQTRP